MIDFRPYFLNLFLLFLHSIIIAQAPNFAMIRKAAGHVIIITSDQKRKQVNIGDEIYISEKIVTGKNSSCVMELPDNSILMMAQNSELTFNNIYSKISNGKIDLSLSGKMNMLLSKVTSKEQVLIVRTITLQCSTKNAFFVLDSNLGLSVIKGSVNIFNYAGQKLLVEAGYFVNSTTTTLQTHKIPEDELKTLMQEMEFGILIPYCPEQNSILSKTDENQTMDSTEIKKSR